MTTPSIDGRAAIRLSASEKDSVLEEMRMMLGAVQGIMQSLSQSDLQKVKEISTKNGMIATEANAVLMAKLPAEFMAMGMALHQKFDDIATAIDQGATLPMVQKRLADQLSMCVACHAIYRIAPLSE